MRQIEKDIDPKNVEKGNAERAAFAARIGHPKRCEVGQVHPDNGECLWCGAANGQTCMTGFGG